MSNATGRLGLVVLVGGVLASFAHHVLFFADYTGSVIGLSASFVPPGLVLGTAVVTVALIHESAIDNGRFGRLAVWYVTGGVVFGLAAYISLQQIAATVPFSAIRLSVANWTIGGSFIGLLVGFYDVRQAEAVREATARQQVATRQTRRLTVLIRILRHDIRNKLTVIIGHADLLDEADEAGSPAVIKQSADELLEIANRVRNLHQVTQEKNRQPVDLAACVTDAVAEIRSRFPAAQISATIDETARAKTYPVVKDNVYDLLENAVVHNDHVEAEVEIDLELRRITDGQTEYCELVIEDNGPGIPPLEEVILDEEGESQLRHSLGTGLWLTRWVAEESDGRFDFTALDDGGTRVRLQLPSTP